MDSIGYEKLIEELIEALTNFTELRSFGNTKQGSKNKWKGVSGQWHQIDVSLENDTDVLLVECKAWNSPIKPETFLAFLGRVQDISEGPQAKGRDVRGALVTSSGVTSGIENNLAPHHERLISVFTITYDGTINIISHKHFIESPSISSGEEFGTPTISVG